MQRGRHYATFTLRSSDGTCVGVVGPGFDPDEEDGAHASMQGWVLETGTGILWHAYNEVNRLEEGDEHIEPGDGDVLVPLLATPAHAVWWAHQTLRRLTALCVVQGLLLDCDAATLTVWVNGERKGVMVRPGMTNEHDEPVGRLEGPLRWAVDLSNASVTVAGPLPPPASVTEMPASASDVHASSNASSNASGNR